MYYNKYYVEKLVSVALAVIRLNIWECFNDEDCNEMFTNKSINFEHYIECDENLLLSEVRTADEIIEDITNEDVNEDHDTYESNVFAVVTFSEASATLNALKIMSFKMIIPKIA